MHKHTEHEHEHHEHHGHHGHHHHSDIQNLGIAFFLNVAFTLIEIVGGILTNSVAILSDALHDLGDSLSLGLAWGLQRLSGRKRDKTFSYGYKRFSVLGALVTSVVLVIGSIFIIIAAIQRLQTPQEPHGLGMMALAVLGIVVNGAAVLKLRNSTSINAKAIMLHLLEDVLGWVAVLVGSIGIWLFHWNFLDPLLSLGIAVYILFNVVKNLKQSLKIFLQAIPSGLNIEKLTEKLKEHPLVENIHDVHIWTMDGEYNVLSIHVVIKNEKTTVEELRPLKKDLEAILKKIGVEHSTIEFEAINDDCGLTDC